MQITNPQWRLKLRKLVGFVDSAVQFSWMVKTKGGHHVYGAREIPAGVVLGDRTVLVPLPLGDLEWVSVNGDTGLTGDGHVAGSVTVMAGDQPNSFTIRTLVAGMLTANLGLSWSEVGGQTGNIGPKNLTFELGTLAISGGIITVNFPDYEATGPITFGLTYTTSAVASTRVLVLQMHGNITDVTVAPDSPGLLSSSTYQLRWISGLPSAVTSNNYIRIPTDSALGAEISSLTVFVSGVGAGDTATQCYLSFPGYFGP